MADSDTTNPPLSLTSEELGLSLTSYDDFELLATGGMGAVYKARQKSLDRDVAIKVLTHACSFSLQFRLIFKQEAKIMAKLRDPSIVSIYDYGEINGMLYIVMQFIEGRSLHEAAHQKQVKHQEAALLITKIAKALSHAHKNGILHRDIKPANIIIRRDATPVLIDLGLAHYSDSDTMKGGSVFGTEGYTAPEVLIPPYQADQRAEVFSLGALFYELLTGKLPETPFISPSKIAHVDARYDELIIKATQAKPSDRHDTARSFSEDLQRALSTPRSSSSHDLSEDNKPVEESSSAPLSKKSVSPITVILIALVVIGILSAIATIVYALTNSPLQ